MNWYYSASFTEMIIVSFVLALPITVGLFIICYRFAQGITGGLK